MVAAQLLVLFAVVALSSARPGIATLLKAETVHDPNYSFGYEVHDPHTGDFKDQFEVRKGDAVLGRYSVVDADGTKRIVDYTADAHSGFNAVVSKTPAVVPAAKIETVQAVAPVAPVARIETLAPVAKFESIAPIVKYDNFAPVARVETLSPFIHTEPIARVAYSPYLESHHLLGGYHGLSSLIL